MDNTFLKGDYYVTITEGEFFVDVYKHKNDKRLYVVELNAFNSGLTTVVNKQCYRKELENLFFAPLAREVWNEKGMFEAIKRTRLTTDEYGVA